MSVRLSVCFPLQQFVPLAAAPVSVVVCPFNSLSLWLLRPSLNVCPFSSLFLWLLRPSLSMFAPSTVCPTGCFARLSVGMCSSEDRKSPSKNRVSACCSKPVGIVVTPTVSSKGIFFCFRCSFFLAVCSNSCYLNLYG